MSDRGRQMTRREILALLAALTGGAATGAAAQDAAKINPRSYRVAFENDKIRVLEFVSKPGLGVCGQGRHSHPQHLTIVLTNGKVKARNAEGKVDVHEAKAGHMFWSPAETHEVENVGGRDMRSYMVEYKDKDWKPSTG